MRKVLNFIINGVVSALGKVGLDKPNRLAVVLTPLFVSVSGFLCALVAQNIPGAPNLDAGEVTGLFIAGATAAFGALLKWLHGWQQHEKAAPQA